MIPRNTVMSTPTNVAGAESGAGEVDSTQVTVIFVTGNDLLLVQLTEAFDVDVLAELFLQPFFDVALTHSSTPSPLLVSPLRRFDRLVSGV